MSPRALLPLLAVAGLLTGCTFPVDPATNTRYGPTVAAGDGTVRSFVRYTTYGEPDAVGVVLSEAAIETLHPAYQGTGTVTLRLPSAVAPFDRITLGWNADEAEPGARRAAPPVEVHFHMGGEAEPAPRLSEATVRPAAYVPTPGGLPVPGVRRTRAAAAPPGTSAGVSILGSYDGHIVFTEPVATEIARSAGGPVKSTLAQPPPWTRADGYPTHCVVRYDPVGREYTVALEGLTRPAHR